MRAKLAVPRRLVTRRHTIAAATAVLALGRSTRARAADTFIFGLDWKAEAEYGGYYQALATGLYERAGLAVTIRQGGPQVNQAQLLLGGRLDAMIASNAFLVLNYAREDIPLVAVAAVFQKDPAVLIAHPGVGHDSFASLKGAPILIGADTRTGWWPFLKQKFGYDDAQIRPYTFNLAPFLADKQAAQQGYVGSEPYAIEQATHTRPVVLLLADAGFTGYASILTTSRALIDAKPDIVRRFVDASMAGWRSYLHEDPAPGNALIRAENPEMSDGLLAFGRAALLERGIVESGEAANGHIGAMTTARWRAFAAAQSAAGLYPKDLDVSRVVSLDFLPAR